MYQGEKKIHDSMTFLYNHLNFQGKIQDYKRNDISFYFLEKKAGKRRSKPTILHGTKNELFICSMRSKSVAHETSFLVGN